MPNIDACLNPISGPEVFDHLRSLFRRLGTGSDSRGFVVKDTTRLAASNGSTFGFTRHFVVILPTTTRLARPYPKRGDGLSAVNWLAALRAEFLCRRTFNASILVLG
jgi:hypothetical protein